MRHAPSTHPAHPAPPARLVRLAAVTGALAALLVLGACSKSAPAPEPVRAVRTMVVAPSSVGGTVEYAAEVRARVESRLGFRVPGKLTSRPAEVGQRVRVGQVLAQIDASDLRLGQDAASAALRAGMASSAIIVAIASGRTSNTATG
jgi:multidrug efflux pump subunit AcrA (membrane-fusion protein)